MGTSVLLLYDLEAICSQCVSERRHTQYAADELFHLGAMSCHEKVATGREQSFGIVPGRADQRNTARQSFERTNRWNPGEFVDVWPSRNVQRHARSGEDLGHPVVRQLTAITNACACEGRDCVIRIADAINLRIQLQVFNRFN